MNLYDDIIEKTLQEVKISRVLSIHPSCIEEAINQNMVFKSDEAFELYGNSLTLPSSSIDIEDSIELIGPDLQEIHSNSEFVRIAILKVRETEKKAEALYNLLKKFEFTKYHVSPKGFMMRVSSIMETERVRVSRQAIQKGINFEEVGNHFIKAYKKHPEVLAVKIIFITEQDFDFKLMTKLSKTVKSRTNVIDHMTKDLVMNCSTCHEKSVCDTIDGMKELHEQSKKES